MGRIIVKKPQSTLATQRLHNYGRQSVMKQVYNFVTEDKKENNEPNTDTVMMTTNEKIELANAILDEQPKIKAKRMKQDKGLIERKENTIILTEDNRELLKD